MVKQTDAALEVILRLSRETVPQAGQLIHPFEAQKQAKKGQTTLEDYCSAPKVVKLGLSEDVASWTMNNFVDYFAQQVQVRTGGNYRKTYVADTPAMQEAGKFLISNGLPKHEWLKKFIDWSFDNREGIIKRHGYFTPQSILRGINYFIQDAALPQVETGELVRGASDVSLLEEILAADKEGKALEIFARFGIPITFTYLINMRKFNPELLLANTKKHFEKIAKTDPEVLSRIFNASVISSPYPALFAMREWRQEFLKTTKPFEKESWWRDLDYKGKPLEKYLALLV